MSPDRFDILAVLFSTAIVGLAFRYLSGSLKPVADAVTAYAGGF